jgi:hypothetical protein
MAKSWSGFVPLNHRVREQWELLNFCELQAPADLEPLFREFFRILEETVSPDDEELNDD